MSQTGTIYIIINRELFGDFLCLSLAKPVVLGVFYPESHAKDLKTLSEDMSHAAEHKFSFQWDVSIVKVYAIGIHGFQGENMSIGASSTIRR